MKNIQKFIELAIQGGWNPKLTIDISRNKSPHSHWTVEKGFWSCEDCTENFVRYADILLDPKAWQTVQFSMWKQSKWMEPSYGEYMKRFVGHLVDGKTIEEALGEILK